MLTKRQEKILNTLTQEYIKTATPVSSKFLEKKCRLGISPATIRIELQKITDLGFIEQPHTSAGRVPTNKGYRHFADKVVSEPENKEVFSSFVFQEIRITRQQISEELELAQELIKSLSETFLALEISSVIEKKDLPEILSKIGPARTIHQKNISIFSEIIKELENF